MSLDIYLELEGANVAPTEPAILIREDGMIRSIAREEWDMRYPGREPAMPRITTDTSTIVFHANITHNLGKMAAEAGIYKHVWRPEELGITQARELIEPLTEGLRQLVSDPENYKSFNPVNGWGSYDTLVDFLQRYLGACIAYPYARPRASR